MRLLIAIFLLLLIVGCATPYYPVYVGDSGDYYIAETESTGYYDPYYGAAPGSLSYIGAYPWWEFSYYSPYFYPYHFSVWQPGWGHGYYGWYSGYYPYWCPPYRVAAREDAMHYAGIDNGTPGVADPFPPTVTGPLYSSGNPALLRPRDQRQPGRDIRRSHEPTIVLSAPTVGGNPTAYLPSTPVYGTRRTSRASMISYPRPRASSGSSFSGSSFSTSTSSSIRSSSRSSISGTSHEQ